MIAYVFYQLKDYENRYLTHDLELTTMVFTFKIQRYYLYEVKTNVYIDHKSSKRFFIQKELNMRQRQ